MENLTSLKKIREVKLIPIDTNKDTKFITEINSYSISEKCIMFTSNIYFQELTKYIGLDCCIDISMWAIDNITMKDEIIKISYDYFRLTDIKIETSVDGINSDAIITYCFTR